MIAIQFEWKETTDKPIGGNFVGTSPEFEVALYTLIYLMNEGSKVPLQIADYELEIHCYRLRGQGIATAYPVSKEDL